MIFSAGLRSGARSGALGDDRLVPGDRAAHHAEVLALIHAPVDLDRAALGVFLEVEGVDHVRVYRAALVKDDGACELSTAERRFCTACGSALWVYSPEWPDLIHPFASIVDSELPRPPHLVHMMTRFAPG